MKLVGALVLVASVVSSCSSTVLVQAPPRMVLEREGTIGLVAFDVSSGENGARDVSSRFLQAIHEGQPGVPVVELGSSATVLDAVGRTSMDADAIREIGKKYHVDAVIVGVLTTKESKPKVDLNLSQGLRLGAVQAQVRLDGTLNAKLFKTDGGATVWSGSSSRWIQLAGMSGDSSGYGSVAVADRDRQVEQLVADMVQEASCDFRPTWERHPAP
jgi:hypothetical protein